MSFFSDIQAFEKLCLEQASQNTDNITEELFTQAVVKSPTKMSDPQAKFSKGLLVNQWYPEAGGAYSSMVTTATNMSGADSLSRIKSTLSAKPFYGKDGVVTLTNNTEQAYRAEKLGWPAGEGANGWVWSGRQSTPYAMVAASIQYIIGKHT